jgi:5'-phosphate synthase pdxT subunit
MGTGVTEQNENQEFLVDSLLAANGPELGDDVLAPGGERNRHSVERLRAEEPAERDGETERQHRKERPRIGVLAIQGDYAAHAAALADAGADPVEVRNPEELDELDGLILPGGESTTMLKFLERRHFFDKLRDFAAQKPVFGTCAGAILLARDVQHPPQRSLGLLDTVVERNAYGRQIDSSILTAPTSLPGDPLEMVFIRAPRIVQAGPEVEVLARRDGYPVLVRQGNLMAATFHPELSSDRRVHRLFVEAVRDQARS